MNGRSIEEQRRTERARLMLGRARWAAREFARFDADHVRRIVAQVADAAAASAQEYAERAVRETGFGVVEHKRIKNELCSRGLVEHYAGADFTSARVDAAAKIVEIPRPAGVIFALTPSTNPVSTVYFTVLLTLMTRNAVIISPHPAARGSSADAVRTLERAAVAAGAPDGAIQVVDEPSIALVEALMTDERTDLILATGGQAVVRAAYGSGNPALGVGPGNAPVFVTATADLPAAAEHIVTSKAFDNSVMCTAESVVIADERIAVPLVEHLRHAGAHPCTPEDRDRLRSYLFPGGALNTSAIGKDATWIAGEAGITVPPGTRVLLAPFESAVPEEPFTHEKLSPVLGLQTVAGAREGTAAARAILRIAGAGHSAAIHSSVPREIMHYAAGVGALRVIVNTGSSTGAGGFSTALAPTMTVGTGYLGRSSLGENLGPQHLVDWQRVAYDSAAGFGDFTGLQPWDADEIEHTGREAVRAAAPPNGHRPGDRPASPDRPDLAALREEIRRLVIQELHDVIGTDHG
ncbi:aldehyde dehydrogenase family protein [Actinomadura sp. 3N407]|uniref:aldehyde dehydrogenase family protein n=1 Tax=Actinomadura sp. 3N407 TaxID=3457423 RepID=UPI003FCE5D14